jgi:hypothetical protein
MVVMKGKSLLPGFGATATVGLVGRLYACRLMRVMMEPIKPGRKAEADALRRPLQQ